MTPPENLPARAPTQLERLVALLRESGGPHPGGGRLGPAEEPETALSRVEPAGGGGPSPRDVTRLARGSVRYAVDATAFVALLPVRVAGVVGRVEALLSTVEGVAAEATGAVADARRVARAAGEVVLDAHRTSTVAQELVALYEPTARRSAPAVERIAEQLQADELEALLVMIDQLPALTRTMVDEVMPVLGTLDSVGPDIHNLLSTAMDVREAAVGIPGFSFFRKRGEDKIDPDREPGERAQG